MFGLNSGQSLGLGLFIFGLLFMGVQRLIESRKAKPQEVDPVGALAKLLKLIKTYGLGMVVTAVGLLMMLISTVQNDDDGGGTPSPTPTSSSSSPTPT